MFSCIIFISKILSAEVTYDTKQLNDMNGGRVEGRRKREKKKRTHLAARKIKQFLQFSISVYGPFVVILLISCGLLLPEDCTHLTHPDSNTYTPSKGYV